MLAELDIEQLLGGSGGAAVTGTVLLLALVLFWRSLFWPLLVHVGQATVNVGEPFVAAFVRWAQADALTNFTQGALTQLGLTSLPLLISVAASTFLQTLNMVRYSWIPWAINQGQVFAVGIGQSVYNGAMTAISATAGFLTTEIDAVEQTAMAGINALRGAVASDIAGVYGTIGNVEGAIQRELVGIEQGITQEITGAEHALEISLQNTANGLRQDITATAQGIEQGIASVAHGLQQDIAAGDRAISGYISGTLAPAIAGAVAVAGSAVSEFEQWRKQCGDPLCNNLGGLSTVLGLLEGLGMDALFIALIAECVHNPRAVVDDMQAVVLTPARDVYDAVAGAAGAAA